MIRVSDAWKASMNENTAYYASAEILLADGTSLTVLPGDICLRTNRFTDGAGASSFPVGAAMSRTMQLELANWDERYAGTDFLGAVIRLYLWYNGESVTLGRYTVRTPETYGETVALTAQDDMYKADAPFETALTYPTTAGALWSEICTRCGLTDGMTGGIPQGSYTIPAAPSGELTYRAVLGYIAMLSGGNARVSRAGALEIVNYNRDGLAVLAGFQHDGQGNIKITYKDVTAADPNGDGNVVIMSGGTFTHDGSGNILWSVGGDWDVHDLRYWRSLRVDTEDTEITGVQTTAADGTEVLEGAAGYVLALENPLFAGQEQAALAAVGAAVIGLRFRGFAGEYIAYPLAEFGDLCRITDRRGRQYASLVTDAVFTWGGPTVLENSAESPMRNASRYVGPETRAIQKAEQLTAEERTAREAAVQQLAEALAAAGGMYETTEAAAGGGSIYYLHDKPTLAASGIVLKLTAEALGISTDGGQTYPTGWNFATGATVTNILQAIGINADWINAGALTVKTSDSPYARILFQASQDTHEVEIIGMTAGYVARGAAWIPYLDGDTNIFTEGAVVVRGNGVGEKIALMGPGHLWFGRNDSMDHDDIGVDLTSGGLIIDTDSSGNYSIAFHPPNSGNPAVLDAAALTALENRWAELWTGSTAAFPAQTVSVDLSGYSVIAVTFLVARSGATFTQVTAGKGAYTTASAMALINPSSTGADYIGAQRNFTANDAGITFEAATGIVSAANYSADNDLMIPVAIYGVR